MSISLFELFSIGIGPSSSHTVGPMRAARLFVNALDEGTLNNIHQVKVDLYGSLALTGKGHATDKAILMGLENESPESIDPTTVNERCQAIADTQQLRLADKNYIHFTMQQDMLFHQQESLPEHANGMRITVYDKAQNPLLSKTYFSIGGGFVLDETQIKNDKNLTNNEVALPYPFATAKELLALCEEQQLSIKEIMLANEKILHPKKDIRKGIIHIAEEMLACIERGCHTPGILPGGLDVKRRAPQLLEKLQNQSKATLADPLNWLSVYALAVNEENAAGGRVVTAPTNGAAGVIPAILKAYLNFMPDANEEGIITYLSTAAAIAILYKKGASISAAEVGCQGEIGVACSMAAGGLAAVLGGSPHQIENAAEMGMEHHLGLTCDPIKGLVQIPCIERNAMGAVQALSSAKLALLEDGQHKVSLDNVIATMLQTGKDMMSRYKETSLGGLAVNVPEC